MSVTAARGFRAAGAAAGLKPSGRPDVALVVNDGPADAAAGVFTRNRVQAAPVLWTRQVLTTGRLRAVVLNSGGANACTGPEGFADTHATAEHVGAALGIGAGEVAVCSTGLIGVRLPMDLLLPGVTQAVVALSPAGGDAAAEAIRTTDTVAKQAVRTSTSGAAGDGVVTVGGMGKGAAMLAPSLATMLVVVTTDAVADSATLDRVVREACRTTFERVDSDGCLSTNDTVLLLASGASGRSLPEAELTELVTAVCDDLAGQMLGDAEGSTKTISITVTGAASEADALEVGRSVARNNLLKCALYGKDPNWGRVLAAIGTTSAAFEPDRLDVTMNGIQVCRGGAPGEPRELVDLGGREISIVADLHAGDVELTVRTNDLTDGYVYENSAYST
ncbi:MULTISPECIES: bifunctional glutamate N-acetyltransferase/amino-acid acetyltransferase ArgJ [Parafrankia]|uniref:Arginine biosynthesis bifunctional protein ArgJ n=1 Tax=Parafrankia soli TaxID=2599596 RepID=A0A1S1PXE9_9ACTN|nr:MULTISPECIES: bifunctional glutamate N-acetyltransferase/amino-acid acetyltransferase ArgJ [Parafrankia]ABW11176.1 arginine biosynthesis bifunctional protein ArgJ [Frankia sp. EAN1pec]OHV27363.1 bifunctional ornithine acetyltransferase/N-acetylglutamate synthase [Parafrankia soli]TCJ34851.1 bifunctional glutamate N-acetyltransferase/amino-acid acetyltransferase ArgJ [Parafrankia sp. BMG5.11]SQD93884.1 Arginine biosynthesis bifunctional protein ArgJ (Includes: Glutamate N-acetyltransferase; A